MKKNDSLEEFAVVLEITFIDPQTVDFLIRLKRVIERKGQKEQIELIREGLMQMLNKEIEKAALNNINDGVIYLIGDILQELSDNNPDACKIILEKTDFFEQHISYLNSLPISQIKNWHCYNFTTLSRNLPSENQKLLFERGAIQAMVRIICNEGKEFKYFCWEKISNVIEAENEVLKDGQQHPYMKLLSEDGTLTQILQAFINEKNEENQRILMSSLGSLYKAAPLPTDIQKKIIDFVRKEKEFEIMSYLAECPANHDSIMMNNSEKKFFQDSLTEMYSIRIIYSILKYGNEMNKKKVASAVKDEVIKLNDDKIMEKLTNKYHWDEKEIKEIKYKIKEILSIINEILRIGDKIIKVSNSKTEPKVKEQQKYQQQNDLIKSQEKEKLNQKLKIKDNEKEIKHSSFIPNSSSKSALPSVDMKKKSLNEKEIETK